MESVWGILKIETWKAEKAEEGRKQSGAHDRHQPWDKHRFGETETEKDGKILKTLIHCTMDKNRFNINILCKGM